MDKQNIQTYISIADSYFDTCEEVKALGQAESKRIFLKALNDYYQGKIELIIIALIASDLYWSKNDQMEINYYWDSFFTAALLSCEDGDYYLLEVDNSESYVETMEKNLLRFWNHEMTN